MSAGPKEPEKYSIDEMMDRLKSPASEDPADGELVTRADGSQAIRVKRRKRRSTQPHKEAAQRSRKARIVQVSAALVLLIVAGLAAGAAIIYANSSPFRAALVGKIERATGANVHIQQFRMNPKTADAAELSLEWPGGNVLKSLTLRELSAEIFPASFFGKTMSGEEITAKHGVLVLGPPKNGQPTTLGPISGGSNSLRFNSYRIPDLQMICGNPGAPYLRIDKTEGSLTPQNVNGNPQVSLYRGDVTVAGWPALKLDRALIVLRGENVDIVGLRVLHGKDDRGSMEFAGTVLPFHADEESTLEISLDAFDLLGLAGPELGHLFGGKIDSQPNLKSNRLTIRPNESSPMMEVAFRASPTSRIQVSGFPFLYGLAECMDSWFNSPVFEGDASGEFHRVGNVSTLRNLNLASKDRMALRGHISVAPDQALSGQLEIGIAPNMIAAATVNTTRLDSLFGPPREGYRWITLKISGSAGAPADDFKQLFLSAAPQATPSKASPPPEDHAESTFEELTRPR